MVLNVQSFLKLFLKLFFILSKAILFERQFPIDHLQIDHLQYASPKDISISAAVRLEVVNEGNRNKRNH